LLVVYSCELRGGRISHTASHYETTRVQSHYCTDVLELDHDAEHYTRNGVVGECPPSLRDVDDDDGRVLKAPNTWQQSSLSRVIAAKLPAAKIHGVSPIIWL